MRLGAEVVDLVRADVGQQTDQVRGVGQVTVVEVEAPVVDLRVLVSGSTRSVLKFEARRLIPWTS